MAELLFRLGVILGCIGMVTGLIGAVMLVVSMALEMV